MITTDLLRMDYKIFLEPVLATTARFAAEKVGAKTRSKYIRYAVINQLIRDGFELPEKFEPFKNRLLDKGMSYRK